MPDEETPRPREHTARDEAEGTPLDAEPRDAQPGSGEPPAWASPAADVPPPPRQDTGRPARPAVGGWFGRLRAVVWGDQVAPPPPPTPRHDPGPADEPLLPATPRFEAPPRPALLADEPVETPAAGGPTSLDTPEERAAPVVTESEAEAPSAVAAEPAEVRAEAPAEARPARVEPDLVVEPQIVEPQSVEPDLVVEPESVEPESVEPQIFEPQIFEPQSVEPQSVEPQIVEPESVEPESVEPPPTAASGTEAAAEPEPLEPEPAGPEPAAPEADAAGLQPALFDGTAPGAPTLDVTEPPAVPDEERALVASGQVPPEVVEHAIEHALHEAEAALERAPDAAPAEDEPPAVPPLTLIAEALPLPDPDAESPEEEQAVREEAALIARGGLFSRFAWPSHPHYWNGFLTLITGLVTLSFLMFVLVEPSPRWILLVVSLGVAAGMDGVLRATWRASFARGEDTTPYLFLPALYVFAAPLIIEHNVSGHAVLAWALSAGVGFGAIAVAEVLSVRTGSRLYPYARMVTTGAAYFTAFALLALTYVLELHILPAFLATWLVGWMLAVEVVREGEVSRIETVVFAGLVGLLVAQVRWLLYYLPLDGYLAGLALVLVFYFVTGVLHSYVVRQLTAITAAEYALVTVIGMVLVGAARVAGLA